MQPRTLANNVIVNSMSPLECKDSVGSSTVCASFDVKGNKHAAGLRGINSYHAIRHHSCFNFAFSQGGRSHTL